MTCSEEKIDGVFVLGVSGKIQAEASEELLKKLNTIISQGEHRLLLDFSGVDYINSSGVRVLLMAAKKVKGLGGRIALAAVNELIQELLRIAGCASVIGMYPSKQEALKAVKS